MVSLIFSYPVMFVKLGILYFCCLSVTQSQAMTWRNAFHYLGSFNMSYWLLILYPFSFWPYVTVVNKAGLLRLSGMVPFLCTSWTPFRKASKHLRQKQLCHFASAGAKPAFNAKYLNKPRCSFSERILILDSNRSNNVASTQASELHLHWVSLPSFDHKRDLNYLKKALLWHHFQSN